MSNGKDSLINEWLTQFALNASVALDAKTRALYLKTWSENFADIEVDRLRAAFVACIRAHTYKTMPTIGDVRQHLQKAEGNAIEEEAAQKFDQQVRSYAIRRSPDYPDKNPPRISEHTRRAINAAGGLDWIRDCPADELQWARKRFIEAYVRYSELQQDEYLLPPGEIRELLEGTSQKLLPPSSFYEDAHERGLAYAQDLKDSGRGQPDIERAIRAVAGELAPRPPMRSLGEQKKILRERGLL